MSAGRPALRRPTRMARLGVAAAACASLAAFAAPATTPAPGKPFSQSFGDWHVACDNLRRCAAQGYRVEDEAGRSAGLWLSREAGPDGALHARLHLSAEDGPDQPDGTLAEVRVGSRRFKKLPLDADLPPATLLALVASLLEVPQMEVSAAGGRAVVSLRGLKAALLKIDDVQGRVGGVTAWVARGKAAAAQVPAAPPAPVIVAAAPPVQLSEQDAAPLMKRLVRHPLVQEQCGLLTEALQSAPSPEAAELPLDGQLFRIAPSEYLLLKECGRAAYQVSSQLWRVKERPTLQVTAEVLPDVETDETVLMNADFSEGRLSSWQKLRGLGDCGLSRGWVWTARGFALRIADVAPDCNGIFGGGPGLTLWEAQVQGAKR